MGQITNSLFQKAGPIETRLDKFGGGQRRTDFLGRRSGCGEICPWRSGWIVEEACVLQPALRAEGTIGRHRGCWWPERDSNLLVGY